MKRVVPILVLTFLLTAVGAFATELPPGKWWRRPEIVSHLALTPEQQEKLEAIFRTSANDLIDNRGEVEKQNIALRSELEKPQLDRTRIRATAARLSEARSKLFERELMLLVDMRAVLSETQWKQMREAIDRRDQRPGAMGGRDQRPGGRDQRPGGPMRRPRP